MHLDVIVDDLDAGEAAVLALGAVKHEYQPGTTASVSSSTRRATRSACAWTDALKRH